jgi:hypothetical protein
MRTTKTLSKVMGMKGSFRFRLGAACAMSAISENRMESKPTLADKLKALKPLWSGKACYLTG